MNREETLDLYEQGAEAWNKWANEMLEERKRLEEAGEWRTNSNNEPQNQLTKDWFEKATANFSTCEKNISFKMMKIFQTSFFHQNYF